MYRVDLKINDQELPIHNEKYKLISGQVKQGINCIDSFSFSILKNNIGFNLIRDFKTIISVYNEKRNKYEFQGRVLYSSDSMSSDGKITKSVVCESFLGYLQDSKQEYVVEQNWTGLSLLTQLLRVHNSQMEEEKHFKVGNVFTNENIYVGIQRESTWECINTKIIQKIGGEIQLRVEEDGMYIDIVEKRGTTIGTTKIALSKNMISITKDSDPSSYITRLIPLGAKLTDEEGNETEERIDITSVNEGKNYIDDLIAIEHYGLIIAYEYWDDVHEPSILKTKATNFLTENNKVLQKYKIDMVDLKLLGIDIDYIDVCNYYPVENALLNISDTLRVITKTIDIVNLATTNIEIGDNFKTLSDLEVERNNQINETINTIKYIESNYVTNQKVGAIVDQKIEKSSFIQQLPDQIMSQVEETYIKQSTFEEAIENIETKVLYTWIKYADDENGTNMSSSSTGKAYIGIATNKESDVASENPSDYTWSKIQGNDGADGKDGTNGKDGSNGSDGKSAYQIWLDAGNVGTEEDYLNSLKGEPGQDGQDGKDGANGKDGQDGKDVAIQSATAPEDTSLMWYDTTENQLKSYNGSEWVVVNDWSDSINDLNNEINNVSNNMQQAFEEYQKTVSTQLTQTSEDWTFQFNTIVQQITNIDGTVNANYNELVKYIRFKDGTITLGEVNNPLTLTLSNDRMSFLQNGVEVAYINNKKLYITDTEILTSLKIGRFAFVPRENGSLDFKKVG